MNMQPISDQAPTRLQRSASGITPENPTTDLKKLTQTPLVVKSDLPGEQTNEVIDIIIGNIDKHGSDFETAVKLSKDALDKQYGLTWQVIMGRGFSFDITALEHNMLHFYYQGELAILAYKT